MWKTVEVFQDQIHSIRHGSVDAGFVQSFKVLAYGQQTCLIHLAEITGRNGRISVRPYDPSLIGSIAKSLGESGLNAYVFSKTEVVVNCPAPSAEDRERVCSQIKKLCEDAKVSVRNIRKKCKQQLKRDEGDPKEVEQELQGHTDKTIEMLDQIATEKIDKLKEEVCLSLSSLSSKSKGSKGRAN